jgi:uncharacterized membrane-anchored protein
MAGVLVLAVLNWTIYARERHLAEGRIVFLELAPVDPRSMMQGDYMALRFKAADDLQRNVKTVEDGRIVVKLDARAVAQYVRRDDGSPLAADELALRYRVRDARVKFATNAFFFQEGTARLFEAARFGEFRVAPSGELLLTGLRGKDLEPLGPAPR